MIDRSTLWLTKKCLIFHTGLIVDLFLRTNTLPSNFANKSILNSTAEWIWFNNVMRRKAPQSFDLSAFYDLSMVSNKLHMFKYKIAKSEHCKRSDFFIRQLCQFWMPFSANLWHWTYYTENVQCTKPLQQIIIVYC